MKSTPVAAGNLASQTKVRMRTPNSPPSDAASGVASNRNFARPNPASLSLAYLKDSINEVVFANYFLSLHERDLAEIAPREMAGAIGTSKPETPAQRAERLLHIHSQLQEKIQGALDQIGPALEALRDSGVAKLEEIEFRNRCLLEENFIAPNLSVLKLEQDGGVASPFREMTPAQIIQYLLEKPAHDEKGMHQAEKILRNCAAVISLQADAANLTAARAEPDSRAALEQADHALQEFSRIWGNPPGWEAADAGPASACLRQLALLHAELSQKQSRLSHLRPQLAAFGADSRELQARINALLPDLLAGDSSKDSSPSSSPFRVSALFKPSGPLARLVEEFGMLPVAQTFREAIARMLEDPAPSGSPMAPRLEKIPEEVGAYIRQEVQKAILGDESLRASLLQEAVAHCNRGVAAEVSRLASRLAGVLELHPQPHRLLTGPEAAERLDRVIAEIKAQPVGSHPAAADRTSLRGPVVSLLSDFSERARDEGFIVDAVELELLLDMATDYLRRRSAYHEQAARRAAFVERGWTASSRLRRMEKELADDVPTTSELAHIDAELSEHFEALQAEAETFPNNPECPISAILAEIGALEREIVESIRIAPTLLGRQLADPQRSPVLTDLIRMGQRLRAEPDFAEMRIATTESLGDELRSLASRGATCAVPQEAEAAVALCRKADLTPRSLIGLMDLAEGQVPIARFLADAPSLSATDS